jgi:hypothetical protein
MQFAKCTDYETRMEVLVNVEDISFIVRVKDHTEVCLISDPEVTLLVREYPSAILESLTYVNIEGL